MSATTAPTGRLAAVTVVCLWSADSLDEFVAQAFLPAVSTFVSRCLFRAGRKTSRRISTLQAGMPAPRWGADFHAILRAAARVGSGYAVSHARFLRSDPACGHAFGATATRRSGAAQ